MTKPKKILDNPDYANGQIIYGGPTFSPNGQMIAWDRFDRSKAASVLVGDINGQEVTKVRSIFTPGENWRVPYLETFTWSPDSTEVALLERWGQDVNSLHDTVNIIRVSDGTEVKSFNVAPQATNILPMAFVWPQTWGNSSCLCS